MSHLLIPHVAARSGSMLRPWLTNSASSFTSTSGSLHAHSTPCDIETKRRQKPKPSARTLKPQRLQIKLPWLKLMAWVRVQLILPPHSSKMWTRKIPPCHYQVPLRRTLLMVNAGPSLPLFPQSKHHQQRSSDLPPRRHPTPATIPSPSRISTPLLIPPRPRLRSLLTLIPSNAGPGATQSSRLRPSRNRI